jgi:hypothetical protein
MQHFVQTWQRFGHQAFEARFAHAANCIVNAAARREDIQIRGAADFELELVQPVARIDDMGMRIDEAGAYRLPASVEGPRRGEGLRDIGSWAGGQDATFVDGDGSARDDDGIKHVISALRGRAAFGGSAGGSVARPTRHQLRRIRDEKIDRRHLVCGIGRRMPWRWANSMASG